MTEIIVAIITGVLTLAGVIITVAAGNAKTGKQLDAQSKLPLYRIEQLEHKQDQHNTLIERMYKAEERIAVNEEQIKVVMEELKLDVTLTYQDNGKEFTVKALFL